MPTKKEKRVAEVNKLRDLLPATDFEIRISDNCSTVYVNSYTIANSILKALSPSDIPDSIEGFDQPYLFACLATDKSIAKKLKISIKLSVPIHQNFKRK